MTQFFEYQLEARKTRQPTADLIYVSGKLVVEAAELSQEVLRQAYHGKRIDRNELMDECGDVLWYIAATCDMLGVTLEEVAERNIAKLRKRHGEAYRPEHYTG